MNATSKHRTPLATALLVLVMGAVLVSVLLPNTTLAWMRENWVWFNWPMLWIERADSAVNLVHAILFVVLGLAGGAAKPDLRWPMMTLLLTLFGAATELMQLAVPGRHARVSDVLVDVAAGLIGWGLARVVFRRRD